MESIAGKSRVQLDGYRGCFIAAIGVNHTSRADSGSQQEHQPINHTANALARQAKHVCYLVCTEVFPASSGRLTTEGTEEHKEARRSESGWFMESASFLSCVAQAFQSYSGAAYPNMGSYVNGQQTG